jgi:flagellar basal-body rod modification protein FlgD|nr:flagellar hook assembly protein FlgD [Candidatus Krumholzibacteria bacterium]
MPVQGVTDGYGPVVGQADRDYSEINKIDFMTLLVAQIQNQDPMSPMDNSQFTSQITQFTMLEEMESVNTKLDENLIVGQSINNTAMLSLVGKNVTVEGDKTFVAEGQVSENVLAVEGAGTATIEVLDSNGNVVRTYSKNVSQGLNDVTWDGELSDGSTAADGDYTLNVTVNSGDIEVPFSTLMTGPVDGLRYENNVAVVSVGGQEFYVSDIYKVS